MSTYIIADTHFNHENIIKYCARPFENAGHMNEYMIQKWNETVSTIDLVYHLGDVGFGSNEQLKDLIDRLNGIKILLIGNHDFKRGINSWKQLGFREVYKKKIELGKYVLTHEPVQVEENQINIFGHIHDKPLPDIFDKNNHICVSCDVTEFKPVRFEF